MIVCGVRRNKFIFLMSEAVFSVFLGGMIYVIFRTDSLVMFGWFERMQISDYVYSVRNSVHYSFLETFRTFINTVPGGLWTFSYTAFLLLIWKFKVNFRNIFYFLFIPAIAISSEFLQLTGVINGTFDYLDIISYALGALFPFLIHFNKTKINFR